jgi:hypothetical protein
MAANDPLLAHNWTKTRVLEALDKAERIEIVRFLDARYRERFFEPIKTLKKAPGNESGYGFAVMALCCLMIETIESYREGLPSTSADDMKALQGVSANTTGGDYTLRPPFQNCSGAVFENFFKCQKHQKFFSGVSGKQFFEDVRCGLLHQAQTKGGWLISRRGKYLDVSPTPSINRDEFSERLEECFEDYLKELEADQNWNSDIWKAVRKKVYWLAHSC